MPRSRELPSTYVVQNRSNLEEIARLEVQDKMMNMGMGGVLPELADPTGLRRILDVGCGTGGWLIETATTYPMIETLVGVDISLKVMASARDQAERLGLGQRMQFQTMDALQALKFPEAHFDLVNQRAALSWLRTWDWPKILIEYQRVCMPGGIIRLTEPTLAMESTSPALMKLNAILLEAFYRSGRFFTETREGLTGELVGLMKRHGIECVQSRISTQVYKPGTETCQYFVEDMTRFYHVSLPFLEKWARIPDNYQEIYRQAKKEMQVPDFRASGYMVTAWGTKNGKRP